MGNNDIINYPLPAHSSSVENGLFFPTCSSPWIPPAKLALLSAIADALQAKVTTLLSAGVQREGKRSPSQDLPGAPLEPPNVRDPSVPSEGPYTSEPGETVTFPGPLALASLGEDGGKEGKFLRIWRH